MVALALVLVASISHSGGTPDGATSLPHHKGSTIKHSAVLFSYHMATSQMSVNLSSLAIHSCHNLLSVQLQEQASSYVLSDDSWDGDVNNDGR